MWKWIAIFLGLLWGGRYAVEQARPQAPSLRLSVSVTESQGRCDIRVLSGGATHIHHVHDSCGSLQASFADVVDEDDDLTTRAVRRVIGDLASRAVNLKAMGIKTFDVAPAQMAVTDVTER